MDKMQDLQAFVEIKHRLDGSIQRFECQPVHVSDREAVILHRRSSEGRVADLVLPAGSLTFGYFWMDRPYNVYHFVTEAGETLGIYFNICDQTEIGAEVLSWRDLIVDLLATPDGRCRVLDAEELPEDLDEPLTRLIQETEQYLQSQHGAVSAEVIGRTAGYLNDEGLDQSASLFFQAGPNPIIKSVVILIQLAMLGLFVFLVNVVFHPGIAIGTGAVMAIVWWITVKKHTPQRLYRRDMFAIGIVALVVLGLMTLGCLIAQPTTQRNKASSMTVDANDLRSHVTILSESFVPRSYRHLDNLNQCAHYILDHFQKADASETELQVFEVGGGSYQNVRAFFGSRHQPRIVVGAHYDTYQNSPGADDNASGVAGLIGLAYLLGQHPVEGSVELVAFSLEEPPYFGSQQMGSAYHAKSLVEDGVTVKLMLCLEMIGFFSEERNSQTFPFPLLKLLYPNKGNFIGVASRMDQRKAIKRVKALMKGSTDLPVWSIAAPVSLPGIDFSDHRSYWPYGMDAVMITDTAFYRNMAYHTSKDTLDRLDFDRMADVVVGIYEVCAGY